MKQSKPQISIIIPVLNEEDSIAKMLACLKTNSDAENIKEILVVDGGSSDNTTEIAVKNGATVIHSQKGRAKQMNLGAKNASAEILYFLHVDTVPPLKFCANIIDAFKKENQAGCFRMKFDSKSRFLGVFGWLTCLNIKLCRGGDQSLFITNKLFKDSGGFNENYIVYEDNEFTDRLYGLVDFKVLPGHVVTSSRRYSERGKFKLQYHFGVMHLKNYMGAGPEQLYDYYKRKIS